MSLRLTYPVSKSFSIVYSVFIVIVFALCLVAVAFWTIVTKTDCHPYTSPEYFPDKCQPYNLFDGIEVRQSHDGFHAFPYKDTISALRKDFKYKNNTYACFTMNYYRIVLNHDRSTHINYNVSCSFDDGTNFILKASTISNDVGFAWDANYDLTCPGRPAPNQLQSLVFAANDPGDTGLSIGIGVYDDVCTLPVTHGPDGNILEWSPANPQPTTHKSMTVRDYSRYKRKKAAEFAIHRDMHFVVGYTCSDCVTKKGWDLILTLLTSLGAVGGITYTVLIFIAQTLYEGSSSTKVYDEMHMT